MKNTHLRCEYRVDPLGVDVKNPRLSYVLESDRPNETQKAYRILVASSLAKLNADDADLWDSGKIESAEAAHIVYGGKTLYSGERAYWKVHTWNDKNLTSTWSAPAFWEVGLLEKSEWRGRWIGSSVCGGPRTTVPAPFLRKNFHVDQNVTWARLYVTALGLCECHVNGHQIGEDVFTPGWTEYTKRVPYRVYDVTSLMNVGSNAIGAILGDGWYCGYVEWRGRQRYGDQPKFLAQLHLRFADGTSTIVATDDSWKTRTGPIVESDMLMGESYDARLEMPGWSIATFDDSHWHAVEIFDAPNIAISEASGPAVRKTQEITPISPPTKIKENWIFDLGQNMVGRVRLKVKGPRGTTARLRFAEMLNPDGSVYLENLRAAKQTDHYTLRGDNDFEIYESHFTFHGFRYVEISWLPDKPVDDAITGIVLHSNTPPTGSFECSDPTINQLQKNIQWGQRGNFLEVPTDCPQRDERLGWTGDAQVFIRTAAFNMDVASFFTKWMRDVTDSQDSRGAIPPVVPNPDCWPGLPMSHDGGPAWSDAAIICPWIVYLCYGDTRILADHYDTFRRFIDFLRASSPGLIRAPEGLEWRGFGDWLSIKADTPQDLIGTAYFAHCANVMSRIAGVLNKTADVQQYQQLFDDVRKAFGDKFISSDGVVASNTQTANVLALHFDLLPAQFRAGAADALVRDIESRDFHLSTGFVGSSYLPHVLSNNGRLDVAYKLLHQKTWPSWLYSVTQGATTIWERWDGWTHDRGFQDASMNSFNHYAYGAIGAWLYQVVAGIDLDEKNPGYKNVILRPRPGGGLTRAAAMFDSIRGPIKSAWRIEGGKFLWDVELPANVSGDVHIPGDEKVRKIGAGRHHFEGDASRAT